MAITINGKTYRDLPEQVEKNKNDIEEIKTDLATDEEDISNAKTDITALKSFKDTVTHVFGNLNTEGNEVSVYNTFRFNDAVSFDDDIEVSGSINCYDINSRGNIITNANIWQSHTGSSYLRLPVYTVSTSGGTLTGDNRYNVRYYHVNLIDENSNIYHKENQTSTQVVFSSTHLLSQGKVAKITVNTSSGVYTYSEVPIVIS